MTNEPPDGVSGGLKFWYQRRADQARCAADEDIHGFATPTETTERPIDRVPVSVNAPVAVSTV